MNSAFMRLVAAVAGVAALALSVGLAVAQSTQPKADNQHLQGSEAREPKKINEFAEIAKQLNGPAGYPECAWAGRLAVQLLIKNDIDTAFRHIELYDRFGCPSSHIQAAFRCLVRQGISDLKGADTLWARTHACWVNPVAKVSTPPPSAAAPANTSKR